MILAVLLVTAAGAAASGAVDMGLIVVDNPTPETVTTLLARGLIVVRDLETYLLVVAGPGYARILDDLGLTWSLLDPSVEGKSYYTVGVGGRVAPSLIEAHARLRGSSRSG
jgi:hypothetical protein